MNLNKLLSRGWEKHLAAVVEGRSHKSKDEIIREGISKGYDPMVTEKVISFILDYLPEKGNFPIDYRDDLLKDYKIDDEDLGSFYERTLKELNLTIPNRKEQEVFIGARTTYPVEFAIQFLEWCKTK